MNQLGLGVRAVRACGDRLGEAEEQARDGARWSATGGEGRCGSGVAVRLGAGQVRG